MKKFFSLIAFFASFSLAFAQYPGDCYTDLDLKTATVDEMTKEYHRLKDAQILACDTTNSTFHKLMQAIGKGIVKDKLEQAKVVELMGTPYWQGTSYEYENNKISLVRGKVVGTVLPPMFEIPAGETYVIYLWRKTDYLVIAFKGGKASGVSWYKK